MATLPTAEDELIAVTVFRLADIHDEVARPDYHGHSVVPRFFDELREMARKLDEIRGTKGLRDSA